MARDICEQMNNINCIFEKLYLIITLIICIFNL